MTCQFDNIGDANFSPEITTTETTTKTPAATERRIHDSILVNIKILISFITLPNSRTAKKKKREKGKERRSEQMGQQLQDLLMCNQTNILLFPLAPSLSSTFFTIIIIFTVCLFIFNFKIFSITASKSLTMYTKDHCCLPMRTVK